MYLGSHGQYCHQTSWSLSSSYGEYLKDYVCRDLSLSLSLTHTQNARAETCHSGSDCDHISRAIAQIFSSFINCVQKCAANEGGNQNVIIKIINRKQIGCFVLKNGAFNFTPLLCKILPYFNVLCKILPCFK